MKKLEELKENVSLTEQNIYKAKNAFIEAKKEFQSALSNPEIDLFNRWYFWINKKEHKSALNQNSVKTNESLKKLRHFIYEKLQIDDFKGGGWNWSMELAQYIGENGFLDPNALPMSEKEMREAMQCIIEMDENGYQVEANVY